MSYDWERSYSYLRRQREVKSDFSLRGIRIVIENLGPISKAEMVLGDYTALIGPTNSGKTFATLAVNRLVNSWSLFFGYYKLSFYIRIREQLLKELHKNESSDLGKHIANLTNDGFFNSIKKEAEERFKEIVKNSFLSIFGLPQQDLVSFSNGGALASIEKEGEGRIKFNISKKDFFTSVEVYKEYNAKLKEDLSKGTNSKKSTVQGRRFFYYLEKRLAYSSSAFYSIVGHIPAERMATMSAFTELMDFYAKSQGYRSIGSRDYPAFSKPTISNFLGDYLQAVDQRRRFRMSSKAEKLIEGKLSLLPDKIQKLEYKHESHAVKPQAISSGISQLIPLVVITESEMYPVLTVEEPEVNLHANKHVEIADYLWSLKVPMFVTTHSDYFLMKMAHLWASQGKKKSKDLKTYFLNNGVITPLKISETGELDEIKTIGGVINSLVSEVNTKEGREPDVSS